MYAGSIPTQASKIKTPMQMGVFVLFVFYVQSLYYRGMIETVSMTDFRNHRACRIQTHGRRNVIITGPNGAGKTAVLEAVSMLSGDRGMRGAGMGDIARFGGDGGFSVFASLGDETEVCVYFTPGDTNRRVKIDGDNATLGELGARLRMVWVTPREDRIFVEGASDRRAFFDRLAASFDSHHAGRVARLSKLLSERAFVLKNRGDDRWLDVLDTQIAGIATAVAVARIQYAGELNYFLDRCAITVSGMIEKMLIDGQTAAGAEREYLAYLRGARELVGDKMVLDGPHKSDFGVFNNALNLPAELTSTGQQKTTLLDLILAHAKLIHTKTTHSPIILLDEAVAHLDANARAYLFRSLGESDAQVWATGLDANVFADVPDAVFVACMDGEINNILVGGKG